MSKMVHSKYGYETPEATRTFARLEKWLTKKKIDDKRRSDNERRIFVQEKGVKDETDKN